MAMFLVRGLQTVLISDSVPFVLGLEIRDDVANIGPDLHDIQTNEI